MLHTHISAGIPAETQGLQESFIGGGVKATEEFPISPAENSPASVILVRFVRGVLPGFTSSWGNDCYSSRCLFSRPYEAEGRGKSINSLCAASSRL